MISCLKGTSSGSVRFFAFFVCVSNLGSFLSEVSFCVCIFAWLLRVVSTDAVDSIDCLAKLVLKTNIVCQVG